MQQIIALQADRRCLNVSDITSCLDNIDECAARLFDVATIIIDLMHKYTPFMNNWNNMHFILKQSEVQ